MSSRTWIPIALFVGGICAIFASVATGEAEVSLVVIIPVFSGSSLLFLLGTGLILLSLLVGFILLATGWSEVDDLARAISPQVPRAGGEKRTSYGGVVLLGPIPIAFGSDKRTALIMLLLGVAMASLLVGLAIAFL